jgi:hypothetical protein
MWDKSTMGIRIRIGNAVSFPGRTIFLSGKNRIKEPPKKQNGFMVNLF